MVVYLANDEPEPERHCKSKRYIGKIMFLCAVARPRLLPDGTWWDGKIGIWPFTENVAAKRSSVNREKGTLETKPINVNIAVYKEFLLQKVLPAIRNVWPGGAPQYPIYIQQDNAPAHISADDPDFLSIASLDGFNFVIRNQPPNSPDFNVLDLGFFRALQSAQHQYVAKNLDDLIASVNMAFEFMPYTALLKVFLSLQNCMIETLKCEGGNFYKLPHMGKDKLIRKGTLPSALHIDINLVHNTMQLVKDFMNQHQSMQKFLSCPL